MSESIVQHMKEIKSALGEENLRRMQGKSKKKAPNKIEEIQRDNTAANRLRVL